jgi:hypothetical protein
MRKKMRSRLLLVLSLTLSIPALGQWTKDGKLVPDEPWRRSQGKFAVMLVLTDKPDVFMAHWNSPTPGVAIDNTSIAHRGSKVMAFLVFHGCTPDSAGLCNATSDFTVLKPDGTEYESYKDVELWKGKPASAAAQIQLGVASAGIGVELDDPLGEYRFLATIHDLNSGSEIKLERGLTVKQQ